MGSLPASKERGRPISRYIHLAIDFSLCQEQVLCYTLHGVFVLGVSSWKKVTVNSTPHRGIVFIE
ncbi:hypothetical protein M2273_005132 [Mucilaginibacter lappiensis]